MCGLCGIWPWSSSGIGSRAATHPDTASNVRS
jgi:hypothetical protein